MGYSKYAWIGNRISEEDMACLYEMKVKTRKRITEMVAEAVKLYINSLIQNPKSEIRNPKKGINHV